MIEDRLHRPGRGDVGEHNAPAAAGTGEHVLAERALRTRLRTPVQLVERPGELPWRRGPPAFVRARGSSRRRETLGALYPSSVAVGDFNGDGLLDLALTGVSVLINNTPQ